jgi:hypothetical protein
MLDASPAMTFHFTCLRGGDQGKGGARVLAPGGKAYPTSRLNEKVHQCVYGPGRGRRPAHQLRRPARHTVKLANHMARHHVTVRSHRVETRHHRVEMMHHAVSPTVIAFRHRVHHRVMRPQSSARTSCWTLFLSRG